MDTLDARVVFHFRDCILRLQTDRSSDGETLVRENRMLPVVRKGHRKYAEEILMCLGGYFAEGVRRIAIVGDGEGDVRFWRNLSSEVVAQKRQCDVQGFFIDHEEFGESRNFAGCLDFFGTWDELGSRLHALCNDQERCLVLMDVDRTAIFPRKIADNEFALVRSRAIIDYLQGYHFLPFSAEEREEIIDLISFVAENLRGYWKPSDGLCFQNEEAVALATLLCATGCIGRAWIKLSKDDSELSEWAAFACRRVHDRIWVAGLGEEDIFGPKHWDASALRDHLSAVVERFGSLSPVISRRYRHCEAKIINEFCRTSEAFFNTAVLKGFSRYSNTGLMYLSDRPALSLGADENSAWLAGSSDQVAPAIAGLFEAAVGGQK